MDERQGDSGSPKLTREQIEAALHQNVVDGGILDSQKPQPVKPKDRQPDAIDYVLRQGSLNGGVKSEPSTAASSNHPANFNEAARLIQYEGTKPKPAQPAIPPVSKGGSPVKPG